MTMFQNYTKIEKQLLYIVSLTWGVDLLYYLKAVLLRLPFLQYFANIFIPTVVVISILVCLRSIMTKISGRDILLYFGAMLLFLSQYIMFPQNEEFLSNSFFDIFLKVVPLFFIGLLFDEQKHLPTLTYISMIYVLLGAIYFYYFTIQSADYNEQEERMGAAYAYLPHILLITYSIIKEFKIYKLIPLILGLLLLLGTGNRGSLLLALVFVLLYPLFCGNGKRRSKIFISLLGIAVIICFDRIADELFSVFEQIGLNTRVLLFLVDHNFADDNGRIELSNYFIQKIGESPILGYGIMGDRVLLSQMENSYPHNLTLELLVQFGVVLGGFFLLLLALFTIRAWKLIDDNSLKAFFLVIFIAGLLALFISDSYLMNPYFFMYLGLCANCVRRKNAVLQQ